MVKVNINYLLIALFLIVGIATTPSCKKAKENKILGTWKRIPLTETDPENITWEFDASGNVYRMLPDSTIDTATYFIEQNTFEAFVNVDNFNNYGNENINGRYRIEKLNKSIMILLREVDNTGNNGYKRREFEKQ